MIKPPPSINPDIWGDYPLLVETEPEPDFSLLHSLSVKDYQRWLRKQIRQHGRRFEIGDQLHAPVELFVEEITGLPVKFLAGSEVEVTVGKREWRFWSNAISLCYYLY